MRKLNLPVEQIQRSDVETIGNERYPVELVARRVDTLHMDAHNPRYRHLMLKRSKPLTETDVQDFILEDKRSTDLIEYILGHGSIPGELLITHDGVALDGNRRLACLQSIRENWDNEDLRYKHIDPRRLFSVPCKKIPESMPEAHRAILVSRIHLQGPLKWLPVNSAIFLYDLVKQGVSVDIIAKEVGLSKPVIYKRIQAYEWLEEYISVYTDDPNWYTKYSFFEELYLLKRKLKKLPTGSILEDKIKDEEWRKTFGRWIHDRKIYISSGPHSHVRMLPVVYASGLESKLESPEGIDTIASSLVLGRKRDVDTIAATLDVATKSLEEIMNQPNLQLYSSNPNYKAKLKLVTRRSRELVEMFPAFK